MIIDLHMHSAYSNDGEFTPLQLVELAAGRQAGIISITDHNCVCANREAKEAAEAKGICFIPGVEIDCIYEGVNFHVLGYGIDDASPDFAAVEENVRAQGKSVSAKMLEKTKKLGFQVTAEDMDCMAAGSYWPESWTGEMFAECLLHKPEYKAHPLLSPYRAGGPRNDNPYVNFYWDYYSQGKPCYVEMRYPQMAEIVRLIHKNNGLAVLAHPGNNLKGRNGMLPGIFELGMDGIEAFSSYHTPEQAAFYYEKAAKQGLFVTCGSDFHGKTKPAISIGQHGCPLTVEEMREQIKK